ncbi:MAG: hypothetical protein IPK80_00090 [Nannocystis sp.]|nr:hypothetical protein [Nannocystis sp.]
MDGPGPCGADDHVWVAAGHRGAERLVGVVDEQGVDRELADGLVFVVDGLDQQLVDPRRLALAEDLGRLDA